MRKMTIPFLLVSIISGIYGFAGYQLWGTEVARVIFLIAADLFIVSLFARMLFYSRANNNDDTKVQKVKVKA